MSKGKKTTYKVLRRNKTGADETWDLVGEASATSAKAAIQAAFDGDGVYVAVPERSWKPDLVVSKQRAFLAFGTEGTKPPSPVGPADVELPVQEQESA